MKDYVSVATPDHVKLEFELAGPGSRFAALLLDLILIILMILVMSVILGLTGLFSGRFGFDGATSFLWALFIFLVFLIQWGYFIFFEILQRGQTPGKRALGIRVLRDNGLPIGAREAVIRNFLRVADMLPPPAYLLGGFVMARDERGKRLGDMAAGTIVVRERFGLDDSEKQHDWSAKWVARLERGESRHALVLPTGRVSVQQLAIMEQYMDRSHLMDPVKRASLAWTIAAPHFSFFDYDPDEIRRQPNYGETCEKVIALVLDMAKNPDKPQEKNAKDQQTHEKVKLWDEFAVRIDGLLKKGKRHLRLLEPGEFARLLDDYRRIITDLARARSMDADPKTLDRLNRMAVGGHNLLYGQMKPDVAAQPVHWFSGFARQVRAQLWAVMLSASLLFLPAIITFFALQIHPELAFEIVADDFLDFQPAHTENLHDIPPIARPIASSMIMTNNLQVTLLAFGLGLTFGLGTGLILIMNGVHLGAVAGWMTLNGNDRALWGWIMPHGGSELLAIVLAGAAGFMLARALLAPGRLPRGTALKQIALKALNIELGCMVMLVIAGLIEGFISPSSIDYSARVAILVFSLLTWFLYFAFAGLGRASPTSKVPDGLSVKSPAGYVRDA